MSGVIVSPRAHSVVCTFRQQHPGTGLVLNLVAAVLRLLMAVTVGRPISSPIMARAA